MSRLTPSVWLIFFCGGALLANPSPWLQQRAHPVPPSFHRVEKATRGTAGLQHPRWQGIAAGDLHIQGVWACSCGSLRWENIWLACHSFRVCVCVLAGGPWLGCTQGRSSGRRSSSLREWCGFPRHRALQSKFIHLLHKRMFMSSFSFVVSMYRTFDPSFFCLFVYFKGSGNSEDCTRNPNEGSLFPIQ